MIYDILSWSLYGRISKDVSNIVSLFSGNP